ncbi:MAG: hypothetical protein MJK17_23150 [Moritella sp.]|nr:hypothetical protein [Moritella sp.]NRA86465.1 hypothetical protein [Hyphomicrobiales bacterium]
MLIGFITLIASLIEAYLDYKNKRKLTKEEKEEKEEGFLRNIIITIIILPITTLLSYWYVFQIGLVELEGLLLTSVGKIRKDGITLPSFTTLYISFYAFFIPVALLYIRSAASFRQTKLNQKQFVFIQDQNQQQIQIVKQERIENQFHNAIAGFSTDANPTIWHAAIINLRNSIEDQPDRMLNNAIRILCAFGQEISQIKLEINPETEHYKIRQYELVIFEVLRAISKIYSQINTKLGYPCIKGLFVTWPSTFRLCISTVRAISVRPF